MLTRWSARWSARWAAAPIRTRLLALVLVPLVVVLPLLGLVLLGWGNAAFDQLLIGKVRADLAIANGYFERVLGEVDAHSSSIANSYELHAALAEQPAVELVGLLQRFKRRANLDFVALRSVDGHLLATDYGPAADADLDSPAWRAAVGRRRSSSLEVLTPAQFARLAPALQGAVRVPLVATRNAAPTERTHEDRAMVVLATAPVRDVDGRTLGHVQAGLLLNRNLPFIDHINEIVYPEGSLPFGSHGTATLFLDDVRISTNVRLFRDEGRHRAVGTRVSHAVREAVLARGSTWLDRAFVVDDWYVSAYQPLSDGAGARIGMLYVGFLEQPFARVKYVVLVAIGVMFFAVMTGAAWFSLRAARGIFRPVERMAATMQRVESGEGAARVGRVEGAGELSTLAGQLDHLLDVIDDNTRALRAWNAELDAKVAERTRELETAQKQLLLSEKLAAVGQLTASIAHEVNNPIAVIQGNLDLLRELLAPAEAVKVQAELKLVDQQIERMRLIVTQLLQFAKPAEYAGYIDEVDTRRVLDDCLVLVGHLLGRTRIELTRDDRATRRPAINRNELQQVIVNLLVNAVQAMPDGGELQLSTRDLDDGRVEIAVADTGLGLGPEAVAELFQPFVTRKKDGTGLGLWICRSIVERYHGEIDGADRRDGTRGAVFTLRLRCEAPA